MKRIICFPKCKLKSIMGWVQIILGILVIAVSLSSLYRFYSAGFFLSNEDICQHFYAAENPKTTENAFDTSALATRVGEVLDKLESLQEKLELAVQSMEKSKENLAKTTITKLDHKKYLEREVIKALYEAHISLRQIRLPNGTEPEAPLINAFTGEEIRKYITPKPSRVGKITIYNTENIFNSIGHACHNQKDLLEKYMDYEIGSYCDDDSLIAQKLMLNGCDPLPRRRCLARAPKAFQKPFPINESLWKIPDDRNVRWGSYLCRDFHCLSSKNPKRGFSKCAGCFEMEKEKLKWVKPENGTLLPVDFPIADVLGVKPGEIRIGLDFGVGTGSFAARMREKNVTVVTTALNLGAPFSEIIALRGLVPLYATLNQRLPFFDNTMDLIHTAGFLDGWIDLMLLDFILFDWDRVLRPGGLLWIDRFFCKRKDLDDYMYMFLQFRYKKHKWAVTPKSADEVYLSALLEKPPRAI